MPTYFTPGVYVEETPLTPSIAGVGTSTAAFIGVADVPADAMPLDPSTAATTPPVPPAPVPPLTPYPLAALATPVLVTNWEQFKRNFGDFVGPTAAGGGAGGGGAGGGGAGGGGAGGGGGGGAGGGAGAGGGGGAAASTGNETLAHAVYAFFNNGGSRCWVVRVASTTDAPGVRAALVKLEAIDEIAIVAVPGATGDDVRTEVAGHCERMADRVAILDGNNTTTAITPEGIRGTVLPRNQYAALYFPWIEVANPLYKSTDHPPGPKTVFIAPSGAMAGIWARVDAERGVHKAPANELVRGALGLTYEVSKNEQAGLNPLGVNVIRKLGGGITVWGARTLGGELNEAAGEIKYLNVRRLMNFLRESIEEGTQFAVFEPNSAPLWQRITRSVSAFLTGVWRDGALFGAVPEQAFRVICDETTNPPDVRDRGQVVTEIWVAPVKPAEFVVFRITQVAQVDS